MQAAAVLRPSALFGSFDFVAAAGSRRSSPSLSFGARLCLDGGLLKACPKGAVLSSRTLSVRRKRNGRIRASSETSGSLAPLQFESPVGQFLLQILATHPHLLPAAVEQQLEQLQTDRDAETQKQDPPVASGTDLVLYRRIAEVKTNDRKKVLEEILYALIVQKFIDANVSLISSISQSVDSSGKVDSWPAEEDKLAQLHSSEAYEMIKNHLALILGNRLGDSSALAQISKLRVGQVYAASIMYGYFLKRVDQRFQLEKAIKTLPFSVGEESVVGQAMPEDSDSSSVFQVENSHPENSDASSGFSHPDDIPFGVKPTRLRSYVMSFDADTIQRYATIRSKEAVSIIEKHTEALFGRPDIVITPEGGIDTPNDERIKISFAGLRRLVLEAVTFGSFLWDTESYVDMRYQFVMN